MSAKPHITAKQIQKTTFCLGCIVESFITNTKNNNNKTYS